MVRNGLDKTPPGFRNKLETEKCPSCSSVNPEGVKRPFGHLAPKGSHFSFLSLSRPCLFRMSLSCHLSFIPMLLFGCYLSAARKRTKEKKSLLASCLVSLVLLVPSCSWPSQMHDVRKESRGVWKSASQSCWRYPEYQEKEKKQTGCKACKFGP